MNGTSMRDKTTLDRRGAMAAGIFFLVAMFSSLAGGLLLESYITPDFLKTIFSHAGEVKLGVYLELLNGLSVIGIAVSMYPILKKRDERLALEYAALRLVEAVACVAAAAVPMIYLSMSDAYQKAETAVSGDLYMISALLVGLRASMTGLLIPIFFGMGALVFYAVLFRSHLVPRFLSVWGFVAAIMILILNVLSISMPLQMILALPMILNEITLGIYLIAKGVRTMEPVVSKR